MGRLALCGACVAVFGVLLAAQPPQLSASVRPFVAVDAPVVALTHARVIDGTGAAARADQTLVLKDGNIAEIGEAGKVAVPEGATVVDLSGKRVIPGLVMVHEHLYYPTGRASTASSARASSRLYLAGGVTTMRTGGNMNGFMDISLKQQIDAGQQAGPGDRRDRAVPERSAGTCCRCTR